MLLPPVLFRLIGPFSIQSYGLMLVIGLGLTVFLLFQDKQRKRLISDDQFIYVLNLSILLAVAGGRSWFLLYNYHTLQTWTDAFAVWKGGLSMLGAVIALVCFLPWYFYRHKLALLPLLDRITLYIPLIEAIARFGCLFAGCCYGLPSNLPWAITYTDPQTLAPLHIALHPTQLYSSVLCFAVFAFLWYIQDKLKLAGSLFCFYLLGTSMVRFGVDFWRGDQELTSFSGILSCCSVQQITSLIIMMITVVLYTFLYVRKKS